MILRASQSSCRACPELHVKQARGLELTCARLRADVDRLEPAVAGKGGDLALRLVIVTGDEPVEGLAGDLALGQRACEGRVERLHEAHTRGEARTFARGGAVG